MAREAKENPGKFASEEMGNLFGSILIMPLISALFFLALFFILGYTTLLGGPFGFFKFIFIMLAIGSIFFFSILRKIHRALKQTTKNQINETIKVESKVLE